MKNFISGGLIEQGGNNNSIVFHMRHELVDRHGWVSTECHDENGRFRGERKSDAKPLTMTTIMALANIPGVVSVSARHYQLQVTKAMAFSWSELMPQIKLAMSKYLPATYH